MSEQVVAGGRLWDRTRRAVQEQVVEVALSLFADQGFDATTIDQIARAAGISRRTFFRYFGTKEDLVLGDTDEQRRVLAAALEARPPHEDPWTALRRAAEALPEAQVPPARALAVAQLVVTSASLEARHLQKHAAWQEVLAPLVARRMGLDTSPAPDVRATAVVAAALACLDVATRAWLGSGGRRSLEDLYADAVDAVRGS
ncbi:TetR family transcriptional regulator [Quadrisphaera sp. DSM 44207]|uniref:TetR family transcriptional regulator n=1 Tax=Quadrisphaera sp. DSM 44207 TaxID=1881057 RepID=UPI000888495E|nr:TetR family transcriptional regulator [Quadrisphaera sp. DSM 44207]SDQ86472.1 transcriptional regulator, TetR family [Quadrisphaera sp. DSM 44207]